MSTAKKSRKKVFLTPDEALDRLLAEQERKKGKAAKKAVVTQDRAKLAIRDRDEEELETQPPCGQAQDSTSCQHRLGQEEAEDKNGSWRVRVAKAKEVRVSRQPSGGATNVLALVVNTHGSASQQPR